MCCVFVVWLALYGCLVLVCAFVPVLLFLCFCGGLHKSKKTVIFLCSCVLHASRSFECNEEANSPVADTTATAIAAMREDHPDLFTLQDLYGLDIGPKRGKDREKECSSRQRNWIVGYYHPSPHGAG